MDKLNIKKLEPEIKKIIKFLTPIIKQIAIEAAKAYVKSEMEKQNRK